MKRWKIVLAGIVATIAVVAALAYLFIFGWVVVTPVSDHVYTVHNTSPTARVGANIIAFETDQSWVVVDTHLPQLASGALSTITDIADKPAKLAFNTHWHPDHSGGNRVFTPTAEIVAHENVIRLLAMPHGGTGLTAPGSTHAFGPVPREFLPEVAVTDSRAFDVDGQKFTAFHYPAAHTDGDLVVAHDQSGVYAIGDLVWPGSFPYIDIENGGSASGLSNALNDLLLKGAGDAVYIPGHGEALDRKGLTAYAEMVARTVQFVQREKSAGASLSDITAKGLPAEWSAWASALVPESEWIRMIFETA